MGVVKSTAKIKLFGLYINQFKTFYIFTIVLHPQVKEKYII